MLYYCTATTSVVTRQHLASKDQLQCVYEETF